MRSALLASAHLILAAPLCGRNCYVLWDPEKSNDAPQISQLLPDRAFWTNEKSQWNLTSAIRVICTKSREADETKRIRISPYINLERFLKRFHCIMRETLHDGEESDCKARLTCNLDNEKEDIKMSLSPKTITRMEVTRIFIRLYQCRCCIVLFFLCFFCHTKPLYNFNSCFISPLY